MTSGWPPPLSKRAEIILVITILVLALLLRTVSHWSAPNGWRDDELSSALVVTGHVLEGDFRVYYPDASGHEGLYEYFQAASLLIFGADAWGIRGPSILFGTLAVLLLYLFARHLFDWPTAAIAALLLALSFWSLMYSRTGQRHISVTVTTLLSFYFLWRGMRQAVGADKSLSPRSYLNFGLSGLFMGLGFYTYFASRGVPLIVLAWAAYLLVWRRDWWGSACRGLILTLGLAVLISTPLIITLRQQPEAETRVSEVARPLYDARNGDFSTLGRYTLTTLAMFTHDGDEEWLYNIPRRPVFSVLAGLLFWSGLLLALIRSLGSKRDPRTAFVILWLGAGIAPGALSVPAASLGHTILAQPVAMIFPALAITSAGQWLAERQFARRVWLGTVLFAVLILLIWEAARGIYDYFAIWPDDSFNRVLHHSDLHEATVWLNSHAGTRNVAIGSFLVERWDQQVMKLDLSGQGWQVRAFNPESASLQIPGGGLAVVPEYLADLWGMDYLGEAVPVDGPYSVREVIPPDREAARHTIAEFDNGLALALADAKASGGSLIVITTWRVDRPLDLPPFPLLSKPPAPGEDDTLRLAIFIQLLDTSGQRVAGYDGLGVDPYTLVPGDVFVQRSLINTTNLPDGSYQIAIGLYNPASGDRRLISPSGEDWIVLQSWQKP